MHTAWSASSGAAGSAKPVTPWATWPAPLTSPEAVSAMPTVAIMRLDRLSRRTRTNSSTAQYVPNTMAAVATAAGTAYQASSAWATSSPHTRAAGATTTMTDIVLSMRSTDVARRPERERTITTTPAISSRLVTAMTAALTATDVRMSVIVPSTMAQPVAYISPTATSHSRQHHVSGCGARLAASRRPTRAGVVYRPLASTANTTMYWSTVRVSSPATTTSGRVAATQTSAARRGPARNRRGAPAGAGATCRPPAGWWPMGPCSSPRAETEVVRIAVPPYRATRTVVPRRRAPPRIHTAVSETCQRLRRAGARATTRCGEIPACVVGAA